MIDISVQQLNQVSVITVKGRVDRNTAPELEANLRTQVELGRAQLVLDLKEVESLSTAGLRAIVSALKAVKPKNGDLRLCALSPRVAEELQLAGLESFFKIYPDQSQAVNSY